MKNPVIFVLFVSMIAVALFVSCAKGPDPRSSIEYIALKNQFEADNDNDALRLKFGMLCFDLNLSIDSFDESLNDECIALLKEYVERHPDNPYGIAYYGAALGRKAGLSNDMTEKIQLGKQANDLLDDAALRFPDAYIVYFMRAIGGIKSPEFLNRWKVALKDFQRLIQMRNNDPSRVPDELVPQIYYFYIEALEIAGDEQKKDQYIQLLLTEYPDHRFAEKIRRQYNITQ